MTDVPGSPGDAVESAATPDDSTFVAGAELTERAVDTAAALPVEPAVDGVPPVTSEPEAAADVVPAVPVEPTVEPEADTEPPVTSEPVVDAVPAVAEEPAVAAAVAETSDAAAVTEATDVAAASEVSGTSGETSEPEPTSVPDGEPPTKPRRRRWLVLRFGAAFVLGLLLTGGLGAGVLYAWGAHYDGRVLPGVRAGDTALGGLTRDQAAAQMAGEHQALASGQITLTGPDGETATVSYADIGRGLDTSSLVNAALAAGRQGDPLTRLMGEPRAAIRGVTLDVPVTYDRTALEAAIDAFASTIDRRAVNASISVDEYGYFGVSLATPGRSVDRAALLAALDRQLTALDAPASITVEVPVVSVAPHVTTAAAEAASWAANRMAADITLVRGTDTWTIGRASLAPLIWFSAAPDGTMTPILDESGIDPLVSALAPQVKQTAQEASFKLVKDHVVAIGTGVEGRTLDTAGTTAAILREIGARRAGATASPVPTAVANLVEPALSTADAEALAAKMQIIGSYSVYYYPIINNHWGGNIEAPATKIDGTIVKAGAIFDFWKVVGDLRLLPGEGPGNAIVGGKITVTGSFGGGICTTSTTLFNAAIRAGMVPLARQAHNEFINRYPPGLDATVWIIGNTKQTMSFKNDTAFPILITRTIKSSGGKRWLTFNIWSVPNGRTTKITDLVIQPGPRAIDTVVEDPTKPVGYKFRNNGPVDGAKVWVTVTIYENGQVHWTKRYYSKYPAVNGVLVVGTKV